MSPIEVPELESGLSEDLLFPAGKEEKVEDGNDELIRLFLNDFEVSFQEANLAIWTQQLLIMLSKHSLISFNAYPAIKL